MTPSHQGGGRSPGSEKKRQILRTRRPTGLDAPTLTRPNRLVKRSRPSRRSSPTGRSPKTATAFPSSQRSFSIVTESTSCCPRYASTNSATVRDLATRYSRRSRSSSRSRASAASRSEANLRAALASSLGRLPGTGTRTAALRPDQFSSAGSAVPAATSPITPFCRESIR